MRRYTVNFRATDDTVTASSLKTAIEEILERLHPMITYRFGHVDFTGAQTFAAEIASDGKKELLAASLKSIERKLPVALESIGWGWTLSSPEEASPGAVRQGPLQEVDPLGSIEPDPLPVTYSLVTRMFILRYFLMLGLTCGLILTLVELLFHSKSSPWQTLYLIVFPVWFFAVIDLPLDIRVFAKRIAGDQAGIEVLHWLKKKPARRGWETVWGLEVTGMVCVIQSGYGSLRFQISSHTGGKEKIQLLKTIIHHASLNYVEAHVGKLVYKRFDAP